MSSFVIDVNQSIEGGFPYLMYGGNQLMSSNFLPNFMVGVVGRELAFGCKVSHGRVMMESGSPSCISSLMGSCYVFLGVDWCHVSVVQQVAFFVRGFLRLN